MESNEVSLIENVEVQKECLDLTIEFDNLNGAIEKTQYAGELAKKIEEKGLWGTFSGTISGANDADLAKSVALLGTSLEITQKIVHIILRISDAKNQCLKAFHRVITDKVIELESNTNDLDSTQQTTNNATILIAKKLQAQLEEKIAHQEKILQHDNVLSELKTINDEKDKIDKNQSKKLDELKTINSEKDKLDKAQSIELDSLKLSLIELKHSFEEQAKEITCLKEKAISKANITIAIISFVIACIALAFAFLK